MVWRVENSGIGHVVKAGNQGVKAGYCFNLDSVVNINHLALLFVLVFLFSTHQLSSRQGADKSSEVKY